MQGLTYVTYAFNRLRAQKEPIMSTQNAHADSLRALAAFLESQPDIKVRGGMTLNLFIDADDLPRYARMTNWMKHYVGNWFALAKDFGNGVTLDINVQREKVCRKIVTGTRIVPAREAEPEHEESITDWVCDETSILGMKA